ncbi:hypothetical protein LTR96_003351 [Exophiala xenobiotica]|nr:hypothetical protein LTR96_003351 [Exophiala xenobiotica]KAK5342763.1 hypothetical protein LTR98_000389 [Exophiala xenobiotica]
MDTSNNLNPYTEIDRFPLCGNLAQAEVSIKQIPYDSQIFEVVVGTEKKVFHVHKDLMDGVYFKTLFKNEQWKENQNQPIFLPDEDPAIFKAIVDYWYTGTLGLEAVGCGYPDVDTTPTEEQLRDLEDAPLDPWVYPAHDDYEEAMACFGSATGAVQTDRKTVEFLIRDLYDDPVSYSGNLQEEVNNWSEEMPAEIERIRSLKHGVAIVFEMIFDPTHAVFEKVELATPEFASTFATSLRKGRIIPVIHGHDRTVQQIELFTKLLDQQKESGNDPPAM